MAWTALHTYRNRDGNLYVRYLYWNGDRWYSNYNWLDNNWNDNSPAACAQTVSFLSLTLRRESFILELSVPAAKHLPDLVERQGKREIFFVVERFRFPENHEGDFERIELPDRQTDIGLLFGSRQEARERNRLDDLNKQDIYPFSERIAMEFGQGVIIAIPEEIDAFAFLEEWQKPRGGNVSRMRKKIVHRYQDITSLENLLAAWQEFVVGKRSRKDVQEFEQRLMENIFSLHGDLANKTYVHSPYEAFNISDPKPRNIHKATVRDRLLHHALYRQLYPHFDAGFVADSFSCRLGKGTHLAIERFRALAYTASRNHTRTAWVLQCDVRKFFASIDQTILFDVISRSVPNTDILWLIRQIVGSFSSTKVGVGLPLGNLTSQLFVNIYMNEFDQFVKHRLKANCYVRYADDFVVLSPDKEWLERILSEIKSFLNGKLRLELHPDKVHLRTLASGVDFLGWVHFPDHRVLRTATKRRMLRRIEEMDGKAETVQSYLGLMSHGNAKKLQRDVEEMMSER